MRPDGSIDAVNVRLMLPDIPAKSLPIEEAHDGCEALGDISSTQQSSEPLPEKLEGDRYRYHGRCHCGLVTYRVETLRIDSGLEHSCSICWRAGYMWRYPLKGERTVLTGKDKLRKYQFGKFFAGHMFCTVCGVNLFNFLSDENAPLEPVNVRTLETGEVRVKKETQVVEIPIGDGKTMRKEFPDQP